MISENQQVAITVLKEENLLAKDNQPVGSLMLTDSYRICLQMKGFP